jgi:hypothetical protein
MLFCSRVLGFYSVRAHAVLLPQPEPLVSMGIQVNWSDWHCHGAENEARQVLLALYGVWHAYLVRSMRLALFECD